LILRSASSGVETSSEDLEDFGKYMQRRREYGHYPDEPAEPLRHLRVVLAKRLTELDVAKQSHYPPPYSSR
jgi:hypothetical protein